MCLKIIITTNQLVQQHRKQHECCRTKTGSERIPESWANNDITNAELGLEGCVMFRKDRIGRRGGGVLLYIKDTIPAYEVQLQEKADCNEAIWCNLVTGHMYNSYHWSSISLSQHNETEQRKNSQCYK